MADTSTTAPWKRSSSARSRARCCSTLLPRALQHGRLDLPDRAGRRGGAARPRGRGGGARNRARRGRGAAAARRRHLAMRPDGGPRLGARLQQIHEPGRGLRRCNAPRAGPARAGAGAAQPRPQGEGPVLPGRCFHIGPRHHRRHDRQQFLRRALVCATATWCTMCAASTRSCRRHGGGVRRSAGKFRRARPARALPRPGAPDARSAPPRSRTRSTSASRSCCARSAATTST